MYFLKNNDGTPNIRKVLKGSSIIQFQKSYSFASKEALKRTQKTKISFFCSIWKAIDDAHIAIDGTIVKSFRKSLLIRWCVMLATPINNQVHIIETDVMNYFVIVERICFLLIWLPLLLFFSIKTNAYF